MPWWLSVLALVSLTIFVSNYVEVLFFAFLFDALYSYRYPMPFLALVIATVFLLIVISVKTRIRT